MARGHDVRIGTSGWSYPATGYGPWTGVFYPLKQGQRIPCSRFEFSNRVVADVPRQMYHDGATESSSLERRKLSELT